MFLAIGMIFAVVLFIIMMNLKGKVAKRIMAIWIIVSWIFLILGFCNVWANAAIAIGMPTSGTFDDIMGWSLLHQFLFLIGGAMFLTCPLSFVFSIIWVSSGIFGIKVKDLFSSVHDKHEDKE